MKQTGSHGNEYAHNNIGTVGKGFFMPSMPRGYIIRMPAKQQLAVKESVKRRLGGGVRWPPA
jgi:hypothetical protein